MNNAQSSVLLGFVQRQISNLHTVVKKENVFIQKS